MMKKVLITGISGFVGQHLATKLVAKKQFTIIGTCHSSSSIEKVHAISPDIHTETVDLTNSEKTDAFIAKHKPDIIYHLAAQSSAAQSYTDPTITLNNNVNAEVYLLEALKKHNLQSTRVLIISSAEVYGMVTPSDIPIDETTPLRPVSPYAVSKIAQDYLALQYHLSYKLDIVRVRPFNHTGPGHADKFVIPAFAKQIAEIEKGLKDPILSVGNLEAKRDFTDVRDMINAYLLAVEKGATGEVYNLGSGRARKIKDLLTILLSFSNTEIKIEVDPTKLRPAETPEVVCDSSKFSELTGWRPSITLEKMLKDTLDYWRNIV